VLGGLMLSLVGATTALVLGASILVAATLSVITQPSVRGLTPDGNAIRVPRGSEIALAAVVSE
jgi:hypothetical protein